MAAMLHSPPDCPGGGAPKTLFCRLNRARCCGRLGPWLVIISRTAQTRKGKQHSKQQSRNTQCMPMRRRAATQCSRKNHCDCRDDACHPEGVRHICHNDLINRIHLAFPSLPRSCSSTKPLNSSSFVGSSCSFLTRRIRRPSTEPPKRRSIMSPI